MEDEDITLLSSLDPNVISLLSVINSTEINLKYYSKVLVISYEEMKNLISPLIKRGYLIHLIKYNYEITEKGLKLCKLLYNDIR